MALRLREVTAARDRATPGLSGSLGLPAPVTRLIGRDDALSAVCELLTRSTGDPYRPGGIGKLQLALAIAHRLDEHFTAGVAFIGWRLWPTITWSYRPLR
jgi:hypothetical protein